MTPPFTTVGSMPPRVEQRRHHRGRRGLAVRPRDRDVRLQPHQLGQHLRPPHHRQVLRPRRVELGVARLDRRGDHHHLRALEVLRLLADEDLRALALQPLGDRARLGVRPLHGEAVVQQHLGDPRHADAADADEVDRPDVVRQPRLVRSCLNSFFGRGPRPAPPDVRSRPGAPGPGSPAPSRSRPSGSAEDRGDVPRQPLRRQLLLADHEGAAGGNQPGGVRRLVVVQSRADRGPGSPAARSR